MNPLQRINYLIDQHVEIPYTVCLGCQHCEEIKKISQEAGMWLGDKPGQKSSEGKKRIKNFTKEQLKQYLDEDWTITDICQKEKFTYNTVKRKIWQWFPEYYQKKNEELISFDKFIELKRNGLKNIQIAEKENISYRKLTYQVTKWRKAGKLSGEAI